jgi:hypothetical protein
VPATRHLVRADGGKRRETVEGHSRVKIRACASRSDHQKSARGIGGLVGGDGAKRPCGKCVSHQRTAGWHERVLGRVNDGEGPTRKSGRGLAAGLGLLAVGPAAAGPDQAVALAVLVLEEVGVDRRREARMSSLSER